MTFDLNTTLKEIRPDLVNDLLGFGEHNLERIQKAIVVTWHFICRVLYKSQLRKHHLEQALPPYPHVLLS